MYAVIMAGGGGTRLWPVSRKNTPKQSQPFGDNQTLVQKTYARLRRGWPDRNIFVSTNLKQYRTLHAQLPRIPSTQFILEPSRRDTAAAIGLAALMLWKKNPKAVMFMASSDHYFKEVPEYLRVVKATEKVVQQYPDRTVLMGVKPTFAHTGLGYIKMKHQVTQASGYDIFSVERFIEKPNQAKAERLVSEWQYLWNIGLFVFRADAMLEKYKRWLPKSYAALMHMAKDVGTSRQARSIKRHFSAMDKISIDYGIMEHDRRMLVIPADVTWADIGSWREVHDVLTGDGRTMVIKGMHIQKDSHGNLIYSKDPKKVVATAGLQNMIIIDTPDALLVLPKDRAQDVKELVAELEAKSLHRYL
jgi:mannose-1-phosphate guanylyltransferase